MGAPYSKEQKVWAWFHQNDLPVAQNLEHCASNAKVMGSIPAKAGTDNIIYLYLLI